MNGTLAPGTSVGTLTLNSAGTGSGTVSGAGSFIVGHAAIVSATASSGSSFVNWTGPNATECAGGIVLMNADKTCTATFTALTIQRPVSRSYSTPGSVGATPLSTDDQNVESVTFNPPRFPCLSNTLIRPFTETSI